jgi:tetratricopeptide (TPR) repeat protein
LGATLVEKGKMAEALSHYEAALQIRPTPQLHYKLGRALLAHKNPALAQTHLESAIRLKPDFAEAYFELAMVLAEQDRLDEGAKCLEKAISLDPQLQQRLQMPNEAGKKSARTP